MFDNTEKVMVANTVYHAVDDNTEQFMVTNTVYHAVDDNTEQYMVTYVVDDNTVLNSICMVTNISPCE